MSTASVRTRTVPASGTELAYRRIGDDAPLVILPGGPRFALAHLRPTLDALANGREVVCVDERRSGSSTAGDLADISTAGTLADTDALLDGLELGQVALAWHSLAPAWLRSVPLRDRSASVHSCP